MVAGLWVINNVAAPNRGGGRCRLAARVAAPYDDDIVTGLRIDLPRHGAQTSAANRACQSSRTIEARAFTDTSFSDAEVSEHYI